MTYGELLYELQCLSNQQLNQDVTVYLTEQDEYFSLARDYPLSEAREECDVLDTGHFYLRV